MIELAVCRYKQRENIVIDSKLQGEKDPDEKLCSLGVRDAQKGSTGFLAKDGCGHSGRELGHSGREF